jgi:L-rhamnose isomerase
MPKSALTKSKTGSNRHIENTFRIACEDYASVDVDVDQVLKTLFQIPISVHCWQGDDVGGFEDVDGALGGGLAVTGSCPGKARTPDELRSDLDKALALIPGKHRVNLHAFYGDFDGKKIDRDSIEPKHFANWIAWAKNNNLGLDFNPTCFSHPKAADNFTLSHQDKGIRQFWIEHCTRARKIGAAMGKALGKACVTNLWVPDGMKDTPADRVAPRERLMESLDVIFKEQISSHLNLDAVEPKLFGIGSESYVVGSHEFYLGYAISRKKLICLDAGHYHPTESIADKISSVLQYLPEILLHVSRGVRWDSDHVVILNDDLLAIAREIAGNGYANRVHLGLDYFDASINRVAAWTMGTRNLIRALLISLLEPPAIRAAEQAGDFTTRLALQEEAKALPFGGVWNYYCESNNVPAGDRWLLEVKNYEKKVLSKRS